MKKVLKKTIGVIAAMSLLIPCVPTMAYNKPMAYLNEDFSSRDIGNWKKTHTNDGITTDTFEVRDGAIHYTTTTAGNGINNEPGVMLDLNGGNGIAYEQGKKIEYDFKVRQESGEAYLFVKLDLDEDGNPDMGSNGQARGFQAANTLIYFINGTDSDGKGIYVKDGNFAEPYEHTSNMVKLVSGDMAGKNVNVSMTIDGVNRKVDYAVYVDGKKYERKNCSFVDPVGIGATFDPNKMKSIAFTSGQWGKGNTQADVYIDDISISQKGDGEFFDSFDDGNAQGWRAVTSSCETAVDVTSEGYLHYKCENTGNTNTNMGGVIRPVNGFDGVEFADGDNRILKFRVKKAAGAHLWVRADAPLDGTTIQPVWGGSEWRKPLTLLEITDSEVYVKDGFSDDNQATYFNKYIVDTKDKWIDVMAYYDGATKKTSYTLTIDGKTFAREDADWSYNYANLNIASEDKWATLSFYSYYRDDECTNATGEVWIDNISLKKADTLFNDTFENEDHYWSAVKSAGSSSAKTNVKVSNGKLHYEAIQLPTGGLGDLGGVIRPINGASGLSYDENSRYVLKFTVNKTAGANLLVKSDLKVFDDSDGENGGWRGTLDLMRISDTQIEIKDGNQADGEYSYWKEINTDTSGKDIKVVAVLDGVNRLANYSVTIDGKTYTFNNCDWSDYSRSYTKHTENLTSLAFLSQAANDVNYASVDIGNVSLEKVSAVQNASISLWDNRPVTSLTKGQSVGALYKFNNVPESCFAEYAVILVGYTVDDDGILTADQVQIVPIDMNNQIGEISGVTAEKITVPAGKKYTVKAFLWEVGTQKPITANAAASVN